MISSLKLLADFCWRLAFESPDQPATKHRIIHEQLCVHQPGTTLQTICSRRSCCCSLCLNLINPPNSSATTPDDDPLNHGFDDGSQQQPSQPPGKPSSSIKSLKLRTGRCLNCFMGYSADCVAICCCPLAIPIFIFATLPVLLFKKIKAKLRSRVKEEVSPYQKLGIDPRELQKPRNSILKDEDVPFIGFGNEHWKECFD